MLVACLSVTPAARDSGTDTERLLTAEETLKFCVATRHVLPTAFLAV